MKTFCRSRALLIKVIKAIKPFASGKRLCRVLNYNLRLSFKEQFASGTDEGEALLASKPLGCSGVPFAQRKCGLQKIID